MSIDLKIQTAQALLRASLSGAQNALLLWSSGKDSQLLLWLARQEYPQIPVAFFYQDHPTKNDFAFRMLKEWDVNVVKDFGCYERVVVPRPGGVELVELYRVASQTVIYMPFEAEPYHQPTDQSMCAIEWMRRPTTQTYTPWDLLILGQTASDYDSTYGPVPPIGAETSGDVGVKVLAPLWNWSAQEVWEASERLQVPQNMQRYRDMNWAANNDWQDLCVRCLTAPHQEKQVHCPKVKSWVHNLSPLIADTRQDWARIFINTKGGSDADQTTTSISYCQRRDGDSLMERDG